MDVQGDDSDGYLSSGNEAQLLRKKRKSAVGGKSKRKQRSTKAFRDGVKAKHGVDLEDVPNSNSTSCNTRRNSCRCVECGLVKENKTDLWAGHRSKCRGIQHAQEKRQLRLYTGAGGEQHRQKLVDTYMLAYFVFKERIPFTMPSRLLQVLPHLHCADKAQVMQLPLSERTITRYGARIANSMVSEAKEQFNDSLA